MAQASYTEVVIGATRKNLVITILDENNNPVDVTNGTVRLQGTSADLPGVQIDEVGDILDGPQGVVKWESIGGTAFVQSSDLGQLSEATFTLRTKLTDANSLVDYGPEFTLTWKKPPI